MTATPVRAVDNKDMSDELFEGNIASEMTLEEAYPIMETGMK